jgi:hypothetical protein
VAQHGHQIGHGRETEVAIQRVGEPGRIAARRGQID